MKSLLIYSYDWTISSVLQLLHKGHLHRSHTQGLVEDLHKLQAQITHGLMPMTIVLNKCADGTYDVISGDSYINSLEYIEKHALIAVDVFENMPIRVLIGLKEDAMLMKSLV